MFKVALAEIMTVFFLIFYIFQPVYNEVFQTRSFAVEMILDMAIQKASSSDNGRFTPEIINEMKDTLSNKFFIPRGNITFQGTTSLTPYNEDIEGTLSIVAPPLWVFKNMFGSSVTSPAQIVRYARLKSEYIDR